MAEEERSYPVPRWEPLDPPSLPFHDPAAQ